MNKNKVIWIINHYASHLETRHFELAKHFSTKGYMTVIITSSFHHGKHEYIYHDDLKITERQPGVFFAYIHSSPEYNSNGCKRILNMLDFCRKTKRKADDIQAIVGSPEFIIGSSAHPFVWETSYSLAKSYRAKFVAEFRDIWPLSLIEVQGVSPGHPFVRLLSVVEKRAYKRSDAIVATMPYAYLHVARDLGYPREKVHWIPNGLNTKDVDDILEKNEPLPDELQAYLDSRWCCVYVGSIVKSECLDYLLDAWKLVGDASLYCAIVGEGAEKERIQNRIDDEKIERIQLFPAVSPNEVPLILAKSKCCLAVLEFSKLGRFGLSKYKLNDYLYSGKPTIFACDSPNVVEDAGHYSVSCDDVRNLADAITEVSELDEKSIETLKESGKNHIRENYDFGVVGDRYIALLESI